MATRAEVARINGKKGGRPRGSRSRQTLEKEAARELVRKLVTDRLEPLIEAQIRNALGIRYFVVREKHTGKFTRVTASMARARVAANPLEHEIIEVWEKDPSVQAFTDLLNRAIDKPKEQAQEVQLTGDWEKLAARLASIRAEDKKRDR